MFVEHLLEAVAELAAGHTVTAELPTAERGVWESVHHTGPRRDHPSRRIAYLTRGPDAFTAAVAEYFQDDNIGVRPIDTHHNRPNVAAIDTVRPLHLADLDGGWVTRAGGNQAIRTGLRSRAREMVPAHLPAPLAHPAPELVKSGPRGRLRRRPDFASRGGSARGHPRVRDLRRPHRTEGSDTPKAASQAASGPFGERIHELYVNT